MTCTIHIKDLISTAAAKLNPIPTILNKIKNIIQVVLSLIFVQ